MKGNHVFVTVNKLLIYFKGMKTCRTKTAFQTKLWTLRTPNYFFFVDLQSESSFKMGNGCTPISYKPSAVLLKIVEKTV